MYLRSCSLAPNRLELCVHLLSSVSCDIPLSCALTFIVHARHDCLLYPFIVLFSREIKGFKPIKTNVIFLMSAVLEWLEQVPCTYIVVLR